MLSNPESEAAVTTGTEKFPTSPRTSQTGQNQQGGLHPEIKSLVQLSAAHAHKVYFSGPLVKHVERHTDGRSVGKSEPWSEVWAQLGGTTLSVWDMKAIEEASKRGQEVPPTYFNITDATVHVLGAVTMPATPNGDPPKRYSNVVTLTTAGLNLLLFSCPSPQALISWATAFRLAAYEKSRLEEIYTAHLLRMSLSEQGQWKDPRSPLTNGRMEGWVQIRVNGQTDWKRLWMSVQAAVDGEQRKNRMSSLFGRNVHEHSSSVNSVNSQGEAGGQTVKPAQIQLFTSARPRDRKQPALTLTNVTQAFAVYPERPELISRSTLVKMEGLIGDEELAGEWASKEGWLLMMPELDGNKLGSMEMLKWIVGIHDAFNLYGRPTSYTWNPRDHGSLMFAYPVGPHKDELFLDRVLAEKVDPREGRGSFIRQQFRNILVERMNGGQIPGQTSSRPTTASSAVESTSPPMLPPIQTTAESHSQESQIAQSGGSSSGFQLPPLSFDLGGSGTGAPLQSGQLSPISERTDALSRRSTTATAESRMGQSQPSTNISVRGTPAQGPIQEENIPSSSGIIREPAQNSPERNAASYDDARSKYQQQWKADQNGQASYIQPMHQLSISSGKSDSGKVTSPTGVQSPTSPSGIPTSPPMSPRSDSEASKYSQPERSTSIGSIPGSLIGSGRQNTTSNQLPPTVMQPNPINRQTQELQQPQTYQQLAPLSPQTTASAEQGPLSPASHVSHSTTLSSPFSVIKNVNKDQPPIPPAKDTSASQGMGGTTSWEPHYKQKQAESDFVFDEPAALYLMQEHQREETVRGPPGPVMAPRHSEDEDDRRSEVSEHSRLTNPMSMAESFSQSLPSPTRSAGSIAVPQSPPNQARFGLPSVPTSPVPRRQTPMGFELISGAVGVPSTSSVPGVGSIRSGRSQDSAQFASENQNQSQNQNQLHVTTQNRPLGRRPSGARAPQPHSQSGAGKRFVPSDSQLDEHPTDSTTTNSSSMAESHIDDSTVDALAALSFLEQEEGGANAPASNPTRSRSSSEQDRNASTPSITTPVPPQINEPEDRAPSPPSRNKQYRSSFAPSKQAEERKARSQAQQAAHDDVLHKPGRPNGKQRAQVHQREGGWESSEDEEEEEEEDDDEDDEDAGEDGRPRLPSAPGSRSQSNSSPVGRNTMYQLNSRDGLSPAGSNTDLRDPQAQQRGMRTLPQIPQRGRSPGEPDARYVSEQYECPREPSVSRPQAQYPPQMQQQFQQQPQYNPRQNIWSNVLDVNRETGLPNNSMSGNRDTFVQMEHPSETMTKAFMPQGLLSAGLQDKQDRSAKRQEELARESGASLINVPNKPPPPQVGLLGAITAHERERKREGGVGAALTEREREKRLAEERQRKLDELQRQQLEQQQQYAAQFGGGMLSPQMTGMMGGFGYPQMMGPQSMYFNPMFNPMMANPQHMFAAQQAAQAYQQAMMAMSTAGSQIGVGGVDGGNQSGNNTPNNGGSPPPGAMMGAGGMGYDPRMSMMSMGMMPMMGMGMPGMSPMGMQMTGGSMMGGVDPRFSMAPGTFDGMNVGQVPGSGQHSQRVSSYNGSPAASPGPGVTPANRSGEEATPAR